MPPRSTCWSLVLGLILIVRSVHAADSPNIVVIYADDLGYGDVHCYNPDRGRIPTPHLDQLAAEGMRFTDAHSSSGVCSPSRYTLLTGRYHWRSQLQKGIVGTWQPPLIAADRVTIGTLARRHGYRTACIGKWHLGWDWPLEPGDKQLLAQGTKGQPRLGPALEGWSLEAVLPALRDRAVGFIAEAAARPEPFLLYLPLTSPHTPLAVNDPWKGKSGLDNACADLIMETDAVVGDILAAIAKAGVADDTLVVFTSENGFASYVGAKDLEARGHYPSGALRGYKAEAWEGGHRVPFIVRWPGVVTPGSVCDQLVHQADLMATFADVFGGTLPDNVGEDSVSLLPLLQGGTGPVREHAVSCSANGVPAVRLGSWKYIADSGSGGWGKGGDTSQPVQLYDLAVDLGETKNLAAAEPERVAQMQTLLDQLIADGRSTPGAPQKNDVDVVRHPRPAPHPAKKSVTTKPNILIILADISRVDYVAPIQDGPVDRGFDHYYGISASLDMFPYVWINDRLSTEIATETKSFLTPARPGPAGKNFEASDVQDGIIDHTIEWIASRASAAKAGTPFFAYVPLAAPHTPIIPTQSWQGTSGINPYADFVKQVDAGVGRVLDALESHGLAENTIVVFTSDNGCSPSADIPQLIAAGHHPSLIFRGHKADLYEGGHRVPFLIRWPARIKAGSVCDHLVGQFDFLATVAELLGISLPADAGEDSVSMLPALLGTATAPIRTSLITQSVNGSFAIRDGQWKLCLCPGSGGWSPPRPQDDTSGLPAVQLYDLAADPAETTNLATECPDRVAAMTARLQRDVDRGRTTPGPDQPNDVPIALIKRAGRKAG